MTIYPPLDWEGSVDERVCKAMILQRWDFTHARWMFGKGEEHFKRHNMGFVEMMPRGSYQRVPVMALLSAIPCYRAT